MFFALTDYCINCRQTTACEFTNQSNQCTACWIIAMQKYDKLSNVQTSQLMTTSHYICQEFYFVFCMISGLAVIIIAKVAAVLLMRSDCQPAAVSPGN